jgi:hypothetical protein
MCTSWGGICSGDHVNRSTRIPSSRASHSDRPRYNQNRNGLIVDARLSQANGTAEPETALAMLGDLPVEHRVTVSADKAYDTAAFVASAREIKVTPHVTQNINEHQGSNIDARTTRHAGYRISLVIRKRIEEANQGGGRHGPRTVRGLPRMGWMFQFKAAAYNLVRLPRLLATG